MKIFKTVKGKRTDVLHSSKHYKSTAKQRTQNAFNKSFLGDLSERDKLLMRGYAQRVVEEQNAYNYRKSKKKRRR